MPRSSASRMPSSMGLMNSLGMVPPVMSFSKTKPSPGAGSSSILAWPYWPWPPVCLMYRPSPLAGLRIVSL